MEDNINNNFIENNINFNEFGFELQEINESLNDFWIKNQLFLEKCKQIKIRVKSFKTSVDIAKSVGTGVSAVGGLAMVSGVVLTPFTAGVSSILWVGGGVATAVGSIATIGTEATDSLKSKKFCTELRLLAEQRDRSAQNISERLTTFDSFISDFLNGQDFSLQLNDQRFEDNNNLGAFAGLLAKGSKNIYDLGNNSVKMFESIKDLKTLNVAKSVTKVKSNANLTKSLGKTAISLAPTEVKGVNTALVRTTGAGAGKLAFRGVSAAAGLVFTVVDVVNLVKDWNKTHPTIDVINHLIDDLEKDLLIIQRINAFITGIYRSDAIDEDLIRQIMESVDNCEQNENSDCNTTLLKEIQINSNTNTVLYKKTNI